MTHETLIEYLVDAGYLKTPRLIEAFKAVDRARFVIPEYQDVAYADTALPIGFGATISQPSTVAFMLETLAPQAGDKILDIGSGSGWTTAILAHVAGPQGHVFGVEIVKELAERAEGAVAEHYPHLGAGITFVAANALGGLPQEAPFDRITAAASLADKIPAAWKRQLAVGGRIVAPVGNAIWAVERADKTTYKEEVFAGFVFVPFRYDD